ncbi:MAG: PfkB family carbohydrate kinase [Gammaproteobacteria bacterium]|nr:PfkB family carbohydrate kinase [Gammaproteobacteria bacterium]MDH3430064.1 PfkB family carbohydrate kinase [Gammaproteobacteria bacterium]
MKPHDVYSYGVVSSSTLYSLRGAFPAPEGYAEIDDVRHTTGGEAANSSIVLSRLGAQVRLDGNWLGADKSGKRTKALLSDYEIDTSRLPLRKGYKGVQEMVFAAQGTRTIFGTYSRLLENADWNTPQEDDIRQAKVICLDPFFAQPASQIAEIAFNANIPVVTVDCQYDDPLLRHTSAVVIAESFIRDNYPQRDPEDLFREYQAATSGLVIFTFGDAPLWYGKRDNDVVFFQPYSVDPVDTTGGGDSFRAGIVFGFLKGWGEDATIEFAAAVGALTCTRFPGVLNAPTCDEVFDFLASHNCRSPGLS